MNPTTSPRYAFERIQRWMQAAVMHPEGVAEGMRSAEARAAIDAGRADQVLTRSKALTALERLAIYGSSYFLRLLECMREEFPTVAHCLARRTLTLLRPRISRNIRRAVTRCASSAPAFPVSWWRRGRSASRASRR